MIRRCRLTPPIERMETAKGAVPPLIGIPLGDKAMLDEMDGTSTRH